MHVREVGGLLCCPDLRISRISGSTWVTLVDAFDELRSKVQPEALLGGLSCGVERFADGGPASAEPACLGGVLSLLLVDPVAKLSAGCKCVEFDAELPGGIAARLKLEDAVHKSRDAVGRSLVAPGWSSSNVRPLSGHMSTLDDVSLGGRVVSVSV